LAQTWLLAELGAALDLVRTGGLEDQTFDVLLVWLCEAALVLCGAWIWAAITVVVREALTGRPGTLVGGLPAPLRRILLTACGVALAGGLGGAALPAAATPGPIHLDRSGEARASLIAGLPLPDRALGGGVTRPVAVTPAVVVVEPGESLWSIAASRVSGGAAISAYWQRTYALNRVEIGADPDLIHPGQMLRLPPSAGGAGNHDNSVEDS